MSKSDSGFMMEGLVGFLDENLFTITTKQQQRIVAVFLDWFNRDARLKRVPDLAERIIGMEKKLRKMAKNMEVTMRGGKLVVTTDAESTALLNLLRRGSDWFDPHRDVDAAILYALAEGAS